MSSVYESIMAGLTEALDDAKNGGKTLQRHIVERPEGVPLLSASLRRSMPAMEGMSPAV